MNFNQINNQVVRYAVEALHGGNRGQFEALLAPDAQLVHNRHPDDINQWATLFFFEGNTKFTAINRVTEDGQTVWAEIESPVAGKIAVKLIFTVAEGKITALDAGRP
ncbi:nuclear transport factor 2 family protein [Mucilaginibacter pedocola]|uniref:SnoaL-like domain-containing protein n=1 Tax=Mucilaginibacter pedocola TaxID=1792845 RepID=A0A1S9P779_9SPHI|nr:nuclear transport factor 2 family protein [Mucilaginibacter pedocola]OOQ56804.1 hypothetical protein BC343_17625 [Mucilaginibacter pedocola]